MDLKLTWNTFDHFKKINFIFQMQLARSCPVVLDQRSCVYHTVKHLIVLQQNETQLWKRKKRQIWAIEISAEQ